jgi:hypothetical protein
MESMDSAGEGMDMMKAKSLNPSRGRQAAQGHKFLWICDSTSNKK